MPYKNTGINFNRAFSWNQFAPSDLVILVQFQKISTEGEFANLISKNRIGVIWLQWSLNQRIEN